MVMWQTTLQKDLQFIMVIWHLCKFKHTPYTLWGREIYLAKTGYLQLWWHAHRRTLVRRGCFQIADVKKGFTTTTIFILSPSNIRQMKVKHLMQLWHIKAWIIWPTFCRRYLPFLDRKFVYFKFHWSLFLGVQLIIIRHLSRLWPGIKQAMDHYFNLMTALFTGAIWPLWILTHCTQSKLWSFI